MEFYGNIMTIRGWYSPKKNGKCEYKKILQNWKNDEKNKKNSEVKKMKMDKGDTLNK